MQIVRFRAAGKIRTPFTLFRRGRRRYPLKQIVLLTDAFANVAALGHQHDCSHHGHVDRTLQNRRVED
mgnify:CR=1 FL=1